MGKLTGLAAALLTVAVLTGCSNGGAVRAEPSATPSPTWTRTPMLEWTKSPEYGACVELYRSVPGSTMNADNACTAMIRDYELADLKATFSDPALIEQARFDLQSQVAARTPTPTPAPVEPRIEVRFDGTGEATVTWAGSDGNMIQRQVTLPYSESLPIQDYVVANVIQFGGSVGCSIFIFNNTYRDGYSVADSPVVDGQTMAQCTYS